MESKNVSLLSRAWPVSPAHPPNAVNSASHLVRLMKCNESPRSGEQNTAVGDKMRGTARKEQQTIAYNNSRDFLVAHSTFMTTCCTCTHTTTKVLKCCGVSVMS